MHGSIVGPTLNPTLRGLLGSSEFKFSRNNLFKRYDFPVRYLPQTEMTPIRYCRVSKNPTTSSLRLKPLSGVYEMNGIATFSCKKSEAGFPNLLVSPVIYYIGTLFVLLILPGSAICSKEPSCSTFLYL